MELQLAAVQARLQRPGAAEADPRLRLLGTLVAGFQTSLQSLAELDVESPGPRQGSGAPRPPVRSSKEVSSSRQINKRVELPAPLARPILVAPEEEALEEDFGPGAATPIEQGSSWKQFRLTKERGPSGFPTRIVVFERVDAGRDPDDPDLRVWCEALIEEARWWSPDTFWEDGAVRLSFPPDQYRGLPNHYDLERSRKPAVGQVWRLLTESERMNANYRVELIQDLPRDKLVQLEANLKHGGTKR